MRMDKAKLNESEILYFYDFLYEYEHGILKGYNEKKFLKKVANLVGIDDQHEKGGNITTSIDNCLQFSPYGQTKCMGILYHVRNAFAHGNLYSINNDSEFLILDYSDKKKRLKCNMLGKIEKQRFYDMISAMKSTTSKNNRE